MFYFVLHIKIHFIYKILMLQFLSWLVTYLVSFLYKMLLSSHPFRYCDRSWLNFNSLLNPFFTIHGHTNRKIGPMWTSSPMALAIYPIFSMPKQVEKCDVNIQGNVFASYLSTLIPNLVSIKELFLSGPRFEGDGGDWRVLVAFSICFMYMVHRPIPKEPFLCDFSLFTSFTIIY